MHSKADETFVIVETKKQLHKNIVYNLFYCGELKCGILITVAILKTRRRLA